MSLSGNRIWLESIAASVGSYRQMIDGIVAQLSNEELHQRPAPQANSVAILLRHLGGNLHSRWTDFLTTDGEKPSRDRDLEFQDWDGDRAALWAEFDAGWRALTDTLAQIDDSNLDRPVFIRGERHTVPEALQRSLTHIAYHVGQMAIIARLVHRGEWQWLTIPPGRSGEHNQRTWGTAASRSILGQPSESDGSRDDDSSAAAAGQRPREDSPGSS